MTLDSNTKISPTSDRHSFPLQQKEREKERERQGMNGVNDDEQGIVGSINCQVRDQERFDVVMNTVSRRVSSDSTPG